MRNMIKKVGEEIDRGNIGSDRSCPYHPSHFTGQNCSFCFCPFYPCNDPDLGEEMGSRHGGGVWSCSDCLFIHRDEVVEFVFGKIRELGLVPGDPRFLAEILPEAKRRFWKIGRAVMVVGATSDAGKSITVAALGRILHRMGYLVAPFKSQNMSLNSKVTVRGGEIAMIQVLQAQSMGLTVPDLHMNPILIKPKGDTRSQVMVEGEPFGDYDSTTYYSDFVANHGEEIVRRNIDWLKRRYDYVVMEGAGSPAEINIYDRDIANMRAARIADADCILVVNAEWGGSYAYALGTVDLLPPEDRRRIKGIIINNVRGNPSKLRSGADELEMLTGIPVIGIIPHIEVDLPSEDSEAMRDKTVFGDGVIKIVVPRFPRLANFTDLDPLYTENTTVVFADTPEQVLAADAIILGGTKNTVNDLQWMKTTGIFDAVRSMKGKVPILGICGGYQMMGRVLHDPNGIEGGTPGDHECLRFFDNVTTWSEYGKRVVRDHAVMIDGGGQVEGYEIHMGLSDVREKPLFRITNVGREKETEGSVREDEMLFGTYLHGCMDKPAFRRYFLSFVKCNGKPVELPPPEDYDAKVDRNLDILADGFRDNLDMDAFMRIVEGRE